VEDEHWLALKDAIEPNRCNLNGLYRVDLAMAEGARQPASSRHRAGAASRATPRGGDRGGRDRWVVVWLVGRKIPTMIDNAYRHLNKADNLRSLCRARA
jgi:hypothetical protein